MSSFGIRPSFMASNTPSTLTLISAVLASKLNNLGNCLWLVAGWKRLTLAKLLNMVSGVTEGEASAVLTAKPNAATPAAILPVKEFGLNILINILL